MNVALRGVASIGGLGYLPRAPATVASLVGAVVLYLAQPSAIVQTVMLGAAVLLGQLAAFRLESPELRDPQYVVIDELAGVWLALLALPLTAVNCLAGAIVFRAIDRFKPWPVRVVDRRGGRWSLMGDDLAAGILANVVLRLALALL